MGESINVTLPLHRHALAEPKRLALVSKRQTLSYGQLNLLVWRAAAYLRSAGLGPGDRVLLNVSDPVLNLVMGLGLARLGVAYAVLPPGESALIAAQLAQRIGA